MYLNAKSAISMYFHQLSVVVQTMLLDNWRKNEFARRASYYPSTTGVELPWYFTDEFINNFRFYDYNVFHLCPNCGTPSEFATTLSETGWETHRLVEKCPCGCVYDFYA